jgi:murein DD-endopeptidase MepM/ murein hydrolase activator NlpD
MLRLFTITIALGLSLLSSADCAALQPPVSGSIVRGYAPVGSYRGHWGIDLAAPERSPVHPAGSGVVTFAGSVAGMATVTVSHGGGLRTSYSYLSEVRVARGDRVTRATVVGRSGVDHELAVVHFSVRVGDRYQDPAPWLVCHESPGPGLRLIPLVGA